MASQCGAGSTKFLQWHSSVGLFQLSFSSGVPVYPACIRWVAQWYPSVHWVNQWHSSGIPVYTGPASVHWLRVRDTRVVSTKCTPGFACCAFSDTTLVCFIVNEHTTKCSNYKLFVHCSFIVGPQQSIRTSSAKLKQSEWDTGTMRGDLRFLSSFMDSSCRVRNEIMHVLSYELFMCECYFGVYLMNTKITLSQAH